MQAQQHREPIVVIDSNPNQTNKAELLDVIAELRGIIKEAIKAIS
jgi:hypothetical protein